MVEADDDLLGTPAAPPVRSVKFTVAPVPNPFFSLSAGEGGRVPSKKKPVGYALS